MTEHLYTFIKELKRLFMIDDLRVCELCPNETLKKEGESNLKLK